MEENKKVSYNLECVDCKTQEPSAVYICLKRRPQIWFVSCALHINSIVDSFLVVRHFGAAHYE